MGEVITDKDKEYEKMEREAAPGPDQAMSDRVTIKHPRMFTTVLNLSASLDRRDSVGDFGLP